MQGTKTPSAHTEDVDLTEYEDLIGLEGLYILAMEGAREEQPQGYPPKGQIYEKRVEYEYLLYNDPLIN